MLYEEVLILYYSKLFQSFQKLGVPKLRVWRIHGKFSQGRQALFQSSPARILCRGLGAGGRGWGRRFCRSRPAGTDAPARLLSRGFGCGDDVLDARNMQDGTASSVGNKTISIRIESDFNRITQHPRCVVVGNVIAFAV